jgi:small conductance mechanosensitive channel
VDTQQPGWIRRLDELHLLTPLRIVLTLVIAWVLTLLVRRLVRRLVSRTIGIPGVDPARAEARQRALFGALRGVVVGVVWTVAVITVVSQLGVNIGAFVATATVVGGAAAFGAQQLVRDLITGLFVLAEDQYGVGDTVDVGHVTGTVERISLRSVRINDGEGRIWHVPHGGVARSANLSKESLAVLDVEVGREMRLLTIEAEVDRLCAELAADPVAGPLLVGPPTPVGVANVGDDRITYRVRARLTGPKADDVRRRWRVLALHAFEDGRLQAPLPAVPVVQVHTPAQPAAPEE